MLAGTVNEFSEKAGKRFEYMSRRVGKQGGEGEWNPIMNLRALQDDFHSLGGRANFGIVVAGFVHNFVDQCVGMLGIVVE